MPKSFDNHGCSAHLDLISNAKLLYADTVVNVAVPSV